MELAGSDGEWQRSAGGLEAEEVEHRRRKGVGSIGGARGRTRVGHDTSDLGGCARPDYVPNWAMVLEAKLFLS